MENFNPLDRTNVRLEGSNLVEASAGTGKTYSIGLLVLRLLLEKENLKISQILMVTFTNQAVAELAGRIRKFLIQAIRAAEGKEIEDKPIVDLIVPYTDRKAVSAKLKVALSELDEAAIQTIHSFCQESLNSYALDSNQSFGLELNTNVEQIADSYVKEFWRQNITVFQKEEYEQWCKNFNLNIFIKAVKEALGGKKYAFDFYSNIYNPEDYENDKSDFINYIEGQHQICLEKIRTTEFEIASLKNKGKEKFVNRITPLEGWKEFVQGKCTAGYEIVLFEGIFKKEREKFMEINLKFQDVFHYLLCKCISEVQEKVKSHIHNNQLLTYDEIIKRMHSAVIKGDDPFREAIRNKFEAVFIDEFQDTDKEQYEIYNKLFGQDKIIFYIGDPKQSIYGWRKADLNTYFAAREDVDKCFQMNRNFRSSKAYVDEINSFFKAVENPFMTAAEGANQIKYIEVEANDKKSKGLSKDGNDIKALQIFSFKTQPQIKASVLHLIKLLLSKSYKCHWREDEKLLRSDIGILVRSNAQAREIKKILSAEGINAVTIDDTKVFEGSQEAKFLLYIMEAILKTTNENINKALLNSFTGYRYDEMNSIEKEDLLDEFREYRETWFKSGIFAAIKKYIAHFDVTRTLMEKNNLRVLTNLNHILELLQEAEYRKELNPSGLYEFLQKQISGESAEGDEYEQRVESDDEAIKILTIHMAKGLEYPIVIAPFLDLQANEIHDYCSYRDEQGIYKFYPKKKGDDTMSKAFKDQLEQENRRLLYVALTRPQYHCFLYKNTVKLNESTLLEFVKENRDTSGYINLSEEVNIEEEEKPKLPLEWGNIVVADFELTDKTHGKLSFSALSAHSSHTLPEKLDKYGNDYDQFIFKDIPGGKNMGTMLHYLFENIDFTNPKDHQAEVDKLVNRYYPAKKDLLREKLVEMVDHVLNSQIPLPDGTTIVLKNLDSVNKLNEMEFDFNTEDIKLKDLKGFDMGDGVEINCNMAIGTKKGLLTGLIDLFFVHDGKYYILDWKSNFLGDSLEHYAEGETMKMALNEGNYHLQYLIYSMAVKNYLEARLPGFNYDRDFGGAIYVYLRGARKGTGHGIYTNKPTLEQVEALERIFTQPILN